MDNTSSTKSAKAQPSSARAEFRRALEREILIYHRRLNSERIKQGIRLRQQQPGRNRIS